MRLIGILIFSFFSTAFSSEFGFNEPEREQVIVHDEIKSKGTVMREMDQVMVIQEPIIEKDHVHITAQKCCDINEEQELGAQQSELSAQTIVSEQDGLDAQSIVSEYDELVSFANLMETIEIICQEALDRQDISIAIKWLTGLYNVAGEIYGSVVVDSDEIIPKFGQMTMDSILKVYKEEYLNTVSMIKGKMMKSDESEDLSFQDCFEGDSTASEYPRIRTREQSNGMEKEQFIVDDEEEKPSANSSSDENEEDGDQDELSITQSYQKKKRRGGDRHRRGISLNVSEDPASLNIEMIDQMKQELMTQVISQLTAKYPELGQIASVLQNEREGITAAMRTDEDGSLNLEAVTQFLRTSALPKLFNSALKGKTGVDVLKSLAMVLRVLDEGLGIFEVILKMLIKITRTVRYYTLCTSSIVADMAREDNMKPIVDLSVSVDSVPEIQAKRSTVKRLTKFFNKGIKKASFSNEESGTPSDPFSIAIHAALSKSRDYTSQFQKLPPKLLLALIHTIFSELEKRNGIVRVSLARKKHKTLMGLQESVHEAIEMIYKAILMKDPLCEDALSNLPSTIFAEILICLISSVKMEPSKLESHISKVTAWIKPLMSILDEDTQLSMLNFLLTDPDAETFLCKSQSSSNTIPVKKYNWIGKK